MKRHGYWRSFGQRREGTVGLGNGRFRHGSFYFVPALSKAYTIPGRPGETLLKTEQVMPQFAEWDRGNYAISLGRSAIPRIFLGATDFSLWQLRPDGKIHLRGRLNEASETNRRARHTIYSDNR